MTRRLDPNDARGDSTTKRRLLFDWASGGWVVALAVLFILAVSIWRVLPVLRSSGSAIGDGIHVESYGFDLSGFELPLEQLAAAGFPKDGIPALDSPPVMAGADLRAFNAEHRGNYVVPEDLVIGVAIGGAARAYPLRLMNWHEVVNDRLGGVPIAVTYHPLCDSVVVLDRRVGAEVLEFGVSGLLHDSNLLLYDRRDIAAEESLWSQLLARAVSGPAAAAAQELPTLPASLTRWERWLARHPNTTVLDPDPSRLRRYQRNPYGNYLRTSKLRFPVEPLVPQDGLGLMERVLVVRSGNGESGSREDRLFPLSTAEGRAALEAFGRSAGVEIELGANLEPTVLFDGTGYTTFYSLWFAWYAQHPAPRPMLPS